jgi:hypothetical protein
MELMNRRVQSKPKSSFENKCRIFHPPLFMAMIVAGESR